MPTPVLMSQEILLSSPHPILQVPFHSCAKGVGAVLRPQSSAHGMTLFRRAIWLQIMVLDPGLLLHFPDSQ